MSRNLTRLALAASLGVALMLSACASPASNAVGSWGNADDPQQPSLELSQDGNVSGTDGCNRLMGSYSVNGDEITFQNVASTLMFCEGVDTWLSRLSTATVNADTMTVFDLDGAEIGTLPRDG